MHEAQKVTKSHTWKSARGQTAHLEIRLISVCRIITYTFRSLEYTKGQIPSDIEGLFSTAGRAATQAPSPEVLLKYAAVLHKRREAVARVRSSQVKISPDSEIQRFRLRARKRKAALCMEVIFMKRKVARCMDPGAIRALSARLDTRARLRASGSAAPGRTPR